MVAHRNHRGVQSFVEHLVSTEAAEYRLCRRRVRTRVKDRAAFDKQKQYVLSIHEGVHIVHSFADSSGQLFDCIPIDEQPALRRSGAPLAQPPTVPRPPVPIRPATTFLPPLHTDKFDRFGNQMLCPPGTVAIRRVTLDELIRFETLDDYFLKPTYPRHANPPNAPGTVTNSPHPHAYGFQDVDNLGGHVILSVWSPTVTGDQIFSLAQQWCLALGPTGAQTVEVGWQVYPRMYGHTNPALFVYWTPDSYQSGGYDYQSFVQYGSSHPLGIACGAPSVSGGSQVEVELSFLLTGGNWWLFLNGIEEQNAVGYFPTFLFAGGPMATGATRIEFGGETAGNASFPPMGSGAFAAAGAGHAAVQRSIHYFSVAGAMCAATLTAEEEWRAAYTIEIEAPADSDPLFYFGGPGGVAPLPG